jgi:anaerobic nitric oxide reductase transcription regulator
MEPAHLDLRTAEPAPMPLPEADGPPPPSGAPLSARVEQFEREVIREAVARHEGNWAAAARELGLHRSNLHHRARRLGLK